MNVSVDEITLALPTCISNLSWGVLTAGPCCSHNSDCILQLVSAFKFILRIVKTSLSEMNRQFRFVINVVFVVVQVQREKNVLPR